MKKIKIMMKTREERLESEDLDIRQEAEREEEFLDRILFNLSLPDDAVIGTTEYKGIEVVLHECKLIVEIQSEEQSERDNLIELAADILESGRIREVLYVNLRPNEIESLTKVYSDTTPTADDHLQDDFADLYSFFTFEDHRISDTTDRELVAESVEYTYTIL